MSAYDKLIARPSSRSTTIATLQIKNIRQYVSGFLLTVYRPYRLLIGVLISPASYLKSNL